MKNSILLLFILLSINVLAQDIVIIHTNDMHSKINGYSPELEYSPLETNNDMTIGGFSRIAGIIEKVKSEHPNDIVLTVDAGDFLMGSLFHPLERNTGFQLRLMKKMGYDYLTLGNHEFDFGPEGIAEIINNSLQEEIPNIILSNIEFDPTDNRDNELEKLFKKETIKPYAIFENNGIKIAFIGLIGYDAADVQPFIEPAKFADPLKTCNKLTRDLITGKKVDLLIALSHSGVEYKNNKWQGEDVKLAKKNSKYLDAIISGHTHTTLQEPIFVKNTPIVQTGSGGQNVGVLTFTKENNKYIYKSHELIKVDDKIEGVEKIQKLIEQQKQEIQSSLLNSLGLNYDKPILETDFTLECQEEGDLNKSTLGPLIADAVYNYVESTGTNTDISIVAAGVIRDQLRKGKYGLQNISDIFRISSLGQGYNNTPGYPLAQAYLTAKELKGVFEILTIAKEDSPAAFCFVSGAKIKIDMAARFLNKVKKIEIKKTNNKWEEIDLSKKNKTLYAVSANSYMLELIDLIRQKSHGLVKVIPKDINGNKFESIKEQLIDFNPNKEGLQEGKEWMALYYYSQSFIDTNKNGIPNIPTNRKTTFNKIEYINIKK